MPVIQNEVGLTLDKIVVATDFTAESEKALEYARALSQRFASRLTVAHVIDLSVATPTEAAVIGSPLSEMRQDSAETMERMLDDLGYEGITAQGKILEAHNPARAIVDLSRSLDANLLIVGTHNRHGLAKLIDGSCSGKIIHSAGCPVLVLGPRVDPKPLDIAFRSIVFATNLKQDAVQKAAVALEFAKDSIGHIHMVHVIEDRHGASLRDAFQQHARAEYDLARLIPDSSFTWCTPEPSVAFGKVDEQILKVAKETRADLIVLGAHRGVKWFSRIWDGVIEQVIDKADCPVLTICTD